MSFRLLAPVSTPAGERRPGQAATFRRAISLSWHAAARSWKIPPPCAPHETRESGKASKQENRTF